MKPIREMSWDELVAESKRLAPAWYEECERWAAERKARNWLWTVARA